MTQCSILAAMQHESDWSTLNAAMVSRPQATLRKSASQAFVVMDPIN